MRTGKLTGKMAERSRARQKTGVVLPVVQAGMLKDFGIDTSRRWDIVHPSELSHQDRFCPRAVYLRITEGPVEHEKFDVIRENIFEEGNQIHAKWQARLRKYTELWGDWKCIVPRCGCIAANCTEAELEEYPELCAAYGVEHLWEYIEVNLDAEAEALLCGHADGAFGNTLVEFKSVGEGTVRIEAPTLYARHTGDSGVNLKALWNDISRPFKSHLNQGDIYLWICQQRGLPFNQISFVYESKWNQMIKEFVVEYDERRSLFLVDQAASLLYAVRDKREPGCKYPGKCKECKPYDERRAAARPRRTVQRRAEED